MPRRIVPTSRVSATGRVATTKAHIAQDAESMLEHDFLTLLDYDPTVERFATNPFSIPWVGPKGRMRRYTPDVIVKYARQTFNTASSAKHTVFEVKPRAIVLRDGAELKAQWRAAIAFCSEFGLRFRVVTEYHIRTPRLDNIRFLRRYRSPQREPDAVHTERQQLIMDVLGEMSAATPRTLLERITQAPSLQAELIPCIWHLINCRSIGFDIDKPLTMATPIWSLENKNPF